MWVKLRHVQRKSPHSNGHDSCHHGEDTKALTKDEEVQAYFKERYRKEIQKNEESSWDTPYRKLLNEVKGTETYQRLLKYPIVPALRARLRRRIMVY